MEIKYPVYIFNTLTKQNELFKPLVPEHVGMYVCGSTVYGDPHLGHARSAITFDIVARYFRFLGYKVRYVRNITDVGHLEDEVSDSGEDKIAKKARLEQIEPMEVVRYYTERYHKFMGALNVESPNIEPIASGHIIEQINLTKEILRRGYGYEVNGSVYFDLGKFAKEYEYGQLSGKVLEELQAGSRELDSQEEKKHAHDFALWKKAKPEHIMKWESPWGMGFPGWHIECTAMSTKYLGVPFDIHGGGIDLQFPHHECEIAQSKGAFGQEPVNYWMHNNMLTINGEKMSKSKGNFVTLEELFTGNHKILDKAYSPMTVRFFMLQSQYSSPIDFSNEALQAAEKGYQRLMHASENLNLLEYTKPGEINEKLEQEIRSYCEACYQHMSDDFNTAQTLAALFELAAKINAFRHSQLDLGSISRETFDDMHSTYHNFVFNVLGLTSEKAADDEKLEGVINLLIEIRNEARRNKDFQTADKIRDKLKAMNIQLKDEKDGKTTFSLVAPEQ